MRPAQPFMAALLVTLSAPWAQAQFVRPPVIVPRVPVHMPVHIPVHSGGPGAARAGGDVPIEWIVAPLAVVGLVGGGYAVRRWRKSIGPRAVVRIIALPPGEAPEAVRQAWIGLELPLIAGQVDAAGLTGREAVSHRPAVAPEGYAVDGSAAIRILASASPEAAQWWRTYVPEVVAKGYQLVFPAHVCERLDDLSRAGAAR